LEKKISDCEVKINESDKKLDLLYSELRSLTGESRKRPKQEKKHREQPQHTEISLADIAVMKDTRETSGNNYGDESVLN
jgi:hypothetical protein